MLQSLAAAQFAALTARLETAPAPVPVSSCGRTKAEILALYRKGIYTLRQTNAKLATIR